MSDASPDLPDSAVTIGRVAGVHGIHGEVKVEPLTDFPERFRQGRRVWLEGTPRSIQNSRWQRRLVYLKLTGIDSREAAQRLQGQELRVPDLLAIEAEDVYYQHDIVGLRVEEESGEALGTVVDILATGANDVYVVHGERGELLLPAIEDVVKRVDVAGGRIVVELLPGLEFVSNTPKAPRPRRVRTRKAAST